MSHLDSRTIPESEHSMKLALTVNGRRHSLELDTRTSLLDALREHIHLTGTKKGCDHGQQAYRCCSTEADQRSSSSSPSCKRATRSSRLMPARLMSGT